MKITQFILLGFLFLFFSAGQMGCEVEKYAGSEEPDAYREIIPLALNNTWIYEVNYAGDDSTYTYRTNVFQSLPWQDGHTDYTLDSTPFEHGGISLLILTPSTTGLAQVYIPPNTISITYVDYLIFPFEEGEAWSIPKGHAFPRQHAPSFSINYNVEQTVTGINTSVETETEAGTFDCAVYHFSFISGDSQLSDVIDVFQYYAPEVGLVAIGYSPVRQTSSQTLPTFGDSEWSWSRLTSYNLN